MLIEGSSQSNKTEILIENYVRLIDSGVNASDIIVLIQNPNKRNAFVETVKEKIKGNYLENHKIYTFLGLVYNTIKDNWALINDSINFGESTIIPNLTGLEVSEVFMKKAVKETGFADYNSKINLLHQLFRRHSLIVQNDLTPAQIQNRSRILKEAFGEDANNALELFKKKTLEHRAFDYLRQLSIFSHIIKNPEKFGCFNNIKYIFADDADEMTNVQFEFLKYLKSNKQMQEAFIAYDSHGSSRMGFLNADPNMYLKIRNLYEEEPIILDSIGFEKITAQISDYSRRTDMVEAALDKVIELTQGGVPLREIAIITPNVDSSLKFCIKEKFKTKLNYGVKFVSGSEKLVETPLVRDVLTLLKLITMPEETNIKAVRTMLGVFLKIPVKYCLGVVQTYQQEKIISFESLKNGFLSGSYSEKIELFEEVFNKAKDENISLYEKSVLFFKNFFNQEFIPQSEKFNFFLKQLADFETVFEEQKYDIKFQKYVIKQLENSIISENPPAAEEICADSLIVSTAQKLIDLGINRKYQLWLDVSSNEWTKQDTGTLYNSWVFGPFWEDEEFTYEKNLELSTEKIKRQLRKLSLLSGKIFAFSSLFDLNGVENDKGITEFLKAQKKSAKVDFNFTPREDQKPVLEYKSGHTAISAVPGAGKTTILLALIIKLIQNGTNPDEIFVLTYMESAARNFKERIKKICPDISSLPNISTIHGLALKILKENSNHVKAGLEADFEVCDENERGKILHEIIARGGYETENFDKYEKAISALKLSGAFKLKTPSTPEAKKFMRLFNTYNSALKAKNTIDYDDMLLLSVKLLEENPEIKDFYTDICRYVIEDEAQDSSVIQQRLLSLLSSKHKNLIRCGDINQSITTTFTNADKEGFERFIKESDAVKMNCSQRCTKDIYQIANELIDYANAEDTFKNAFFDIKMKEVTGRNPQAQNAVSARHFESYEEERSFIAEEIRKIFEKKNDASVAVLVRNNFQINEYEQLLSNYGYKIITRSDCLDRQPVFSLIFSILKFCEHPWQNENILEIMRNLLLRKIFNFTTKDFDYVKNLKTPFILEITDSLASVELTRFAWDLNYWLENSSLGIEESVLKIGSYYFTSNVEKSNIHLIAGMFKKLSSVYKTELLEKIEEISKKPGQYKFFDDDQIKEKGQSEKGAGFVAIMTCHKSKGDEFDFVFVPEITENKFPAEFTKIKIDSKQRFIEHIKSLNADYKIKNETDLKLLIIEETLRLLYVAITRAKRGLFLSCAKKYKQYSRIKEFEASKPFLNLFMKTSEKEVQGGIENAG